MILNKINPSVDLNYWLKCLESYYGTNQIKIKLNGTVKVFDPTTKKLCHAQVGKFKGNRRYFFAFVQT